MAATKHFFSDTSGVVVLGLESLVSRNSHLALDAPHKVVYSKTHPTNKVSVISGGGSGHEPAWSGYVGDGMLAAAVNGEVFASPSTKQIMAAIEHVPSDAGIILCITNYTGDNLHFGLAREKATALGYKIGILKMTDDVGLGREQTKNVGRRGLAGNMFVLKLCGGAAHEGWDFEKCLHLGQSVNDHCVTIGSSLDYCHIPGRTHHENLPADTYSVAQGIHNEAGLKEVTPIPNAPEMITQLLGFLLDPNDSDRAFTPFAPSDQTALLINNFGGVSNFELEALTTVTTKLLKRDWDIAPKRTMAQCFETSLNAPGWSISLLNITGISKETGVPEDKIFELLDKDTTAPAWPRNGYRYVESVDRTAQKVGKISAKKGASSVTSPKVDPFTLESMLRVACEKTLAAEPDLTHWDQLTGDGDCGEAVSNISNAILTQLSHGLCGKTHDGALLPILDDLGGSIEDVGGSLAAILAIFLAAFTNELRAKQPVPVGKNSSNPLSWDSYAFCSGGYSTPVPVSSNELASAATKALEVVEGYTAAREGDRTVMDALIPFCRAFAHYSSSRSSHSYNDYIAFGKAAQAAERGARNTEGMEPSFGRAVYVGDAAKKDLPMDPGAWALAVFLKGMVEGFADGGKIDSPLMFKS